MLLLVLLATFPPDRILACGVWVAIRAADVGRRWLDEACGSSVQKPDLGEVVLRLDAGFVPLES